MSAMPSSVAVVMGSPSSHAPSATATTGLTKAWLATLPAETRASSRVRVEHLPLAVS
jgi:hypothetical protein